MGYTSMTLYDASCTWCPKKASGHPTFYKRGGAFIWTCGPHPIEDSCARGSPMGEAWCKTHDAEWGSAKPRCAKGAAE